MLRHKFLLTFTILAIFTAGFLAGRFSHTSAAEAAEEGRVFELRTYTTPEGKLDALQMRFRQHTMKLFGKHVMTNIGYWVPEDAPLSQSTLIYILAHPSREAAKKSWAAFVSDPEWQRVKAESEAGGKIVSKVESVFMEAADYSPLK